MLINKKYAEEHEGEWKETINRENHKNIVILSIVGCLFVSGMVALIFGKTGAGIALLAAAGVIIAIAS